MDAKSKKYIKLEDKKKAINNVSKLLYDNFKETNKDISQINIVGIGTDTVLGDCLGPLTGTFLSKKKIKYPVNIYGTLDDLFHALNIPEQIKKVDTSYYTIAIDACCCPEENLNTILIRNKPIRPGAGTGKKLQKIGDISVAGLLIKSHEANSIVYDRLSYTPLKLTYDQAEIISEGIYKFLKKIDRQRTKNIFKIKKVV